MELSKSVLRNAVLQRIRELSESNRRNQSIDLCDQLWKQVVCPCLTQGKDVAILAYLPLSFEVDLRMLFKKLWDHQQYLGAHDKRAAVFVPKIVSTRSAQHGGDMCFVEVFDENDLVAKFPPTGKWQTCELNDEEWHYFCQSLSQRNDCPKSTSCFPTRRVLCTADALASLGEPLSPWSAIRFKTSINAEENTSLSQTHVLVLTPAAAYDARGARLGKGGGYYDRFLKELRRCEKLGDCGPVQVVGVGLREQLLSTEGEVAMLLQSPLAATLNNEPFSMPCDEWDERVDSVVVAAKTLLTGETV